MRFTDCACRAARRHASVGAFSGQSDLLVRVGCYVRFFCSHRQQWIRVCHLNEVKVRCFVKLSTIILCVELLRKATDCEYIVLLDRLFNFII